MKSPCPRCGKSTAIDAEIGDFPTRCQRCGALVRKRSDDAPGASPQSLRTGSVPPESSKRIQHGALAGLLISRSNNDPPIIHAHGSAALALDTPSHHTVLRPESRREIARAHARQTALQRAQLQGNHQALGALTWAGLTLALLLAIGAVVLKAHALWQHPPQAHADVLRAQP